MRYKDPERIKKIVEIIEYRKLKEGTEPTITQIAADAGMPVSRVYAYLKEMDEKGIISFSRGHYETPKTEMISDDINTAPIVGSVKCGDPQLKEAEIYEYVRLPSSIFGNKEMYILKAKGDSMVDAGIDEGDTVVVENRQYPEKNDIVVAMDEEGSNTLKRYKGTNKKGQARLAYENKERYPGKEILLDSMRIQGIARFVIKKL
ncbi:MAG: repressor LexA [Clostridia bacterium]|nr:repressor LexA [Clostridia bacterium]